MITRAFNKIWVLVSLTISFGCSQEGLVSIDESPLPESAEAVAIQTPELDDIEQIIEIREQQDSNEELEAESEVLKPQVENLLGNVSIQISTMEFTTLVMVELLLAAEGASEMYVTNSAECLEGGDWTPFVANKEWNLAQTNALATVYVKFRDINGNESECINDTILHDDIGPSINTISINEDTEFTQSTRVILSLLADDAMEMYVTDVEACTSGGIWQAYAETIDWTLVQINSEAAVYVKFKDALGNESACNFDTIVHDDLPPINTNISINADAVETDINQVALSLTAAEASEMYITNTSGCQTDGTWEPYLDTKVWRISLLEQITTVYVKYRDALGNESSCINDTISFNPNLMCSSLSGAWVRVPGDDEFGTKDFCFMKYEAKNINDVPSSQWELEPWVNISQNDAKTRCRELGLGFKLVSNEQWMSAAANIAGNAVNWVDPNNENSDGVVGTGLLFEGHNDDNPNSSCEAAANDLDRHVRAGSCVGVDFGNVDQRRTHQVVNQETTNIIWDLAGNVEEWTDFYDPIKPVADPNSNEIYLIDDSASDLKINHLIPIDKGFWGATWGSSKGVGRFITGDPNVGGAMFRGGSWDEGRSSGIFEVNLNLGPDDASSDIGFRCVYGAD